MKAIKNFILKTREFVEPKKVGEDNPLTTFLNTLTQEEKDGAFLNLSSDKQFEYVKSIGDFQLQAMGDISAATIKALTMLAMKLHKENIDEFEISQNFSGSKEGLKEELFTLKLKKIDHVGLVAQNKQDQSIEYADKEAKEPLKKLDNLFNQENAVFDIMEQLKNKFPMNSSNELPLRTSAVLFVAELMSQINAENFSATLEGLIDGDTPLNASYQVEAVRKEIALDLNSNPKRKLS
jgi:hypothetical protein